MTACSPDDFAVLAGCCGPPQPHGQADGLHHLTVVDARVAEYCGEAPGRLTRANSRRTRTRVGRFTPTPLFAKSSYQNLPSSRFIYPIASMSMAQVDLKTAIPGSATGCWGSWRLSLPGIVVSQHGRGYGHRAVERDAFVR